MTQKDVEYEIDNLARIIRILVNKLGGSTTITLVEMNADYGCDKSPLYRQDTTFGLELSTNASLGAVSCD